MSDHIDLILSIIATIFGLFLSLYGIGVVVGFYKPSNTVTGLAFLYLGPIILTDARQIRKLQNRDG